MRSPREPPWKRPCKPRACPSKSWPSVRGWSVQTLNRIFKGDQPITYETANRLEYVTPYPASFWNNLEAQYREKLVKAKEAEDLEKNLEWLKTIPVNEPSGTRSPTEFKG